MLRKKVKWVVVVCIGVLLLCGCKASKEYQGAWFASDDAGNQEMITFKEKSVEIGDTSYELSQNGIGFVNATKYYQIKMMGEDLTIVFPDKKDRENARMIKPNDQDDPLIGRTVLKMNRQSYPVN